jgi:hypothetical protein
VCNGCFDLSPLTVLVSGLCESCRGVEVPAVECVERARIRGLSVVTPDDAKAYHLLGRPELDRTTDEAAWLRGYLEAPESPASLPVHTTGAHVGTVGTRCDLELRVTGVRELEPGDFGRRFLVTMRSHPEDALVVWFTGEGLKLDDGGHYLLRCTVKSHETYLGEKQTVVQRCNILETREATTCG